MARTGSAMDRVRRCVDDAMVFASLALLGWAALFADAGGDDRSVNDYGGAIGLVLFVGSGVIVLAMRWPLLKNVPVAAAVVMAAFWHYRHETVSSALTWMILIVSAIILARQFLGAQQRDADPRPQPAAVLTRGTEMDVGAVMR